MPDPPAGLRTFAALCCFCCRPFLHRVCVVGCNPLAVSGRGNAQCGPVIMPLVVPCRPCRTSVLLVSSSSNSLFASTFRGLQHPFFAVSPSSVQRSFNARSILNQYTTRFYRACNWRKTSDSPARHRSAWRQRCGWHLRWTAGGVCNGRGRASVPGNASRCGSTGKTW